MNLKLLEQSTVIASQVRKCLPLYKLEKVLSDSNYLIRKVNSNNTQCVHGFRLKPIKQNETPENLEVINPGNFQSDPSRRQRMEPDLFDKYIPELINEQEKETKKTKKEIGDPVRVAINVPLGGSFAIPVAIAPPVPLPAPPIVAVPAVRPRTAPVHLPVFDSSSSDEAIPNKFEENSSWDVNLAT